MSFISRGFALTLIPLLLTAGCGSSGGSGQRVSNNSASTNPGSTNNGTLTARLIARDSSGVERTTYAVGEDITLVLRFDNPTANDAQFVAPDGCGLVNHRIEDRFAAQGSPVFDRLQGLICTLALVTHTIPAGQTIDFPFLWNQTDNNGNQVRAGNYLFMGLIRDTSFPSPPSISIDIGSNKLRVSGTAINNGIIASRTLVKVGAVQVQVNQSAGQNSLSTANVIAAEINKDPSFDCTVTDLGSDVAELTVNLTGANPTLFQPVLFDLNSNDPVQRVTIP